jgi:hypothetical protein
MVAYWFFIAKDMDRADPFEAELALCQSPQPTHV